jgi:hypothetical protein
MAKYDIEVRRLRTDVDSAIADIATAESDIADLSDAVEAIVYGTYNPTRSAEANITGTVTMATAQYVQVGSTVTVSGRFTVDPDLAATPTSFEFTLPVGSNLAAIGQLAGVAFCGAIAGMGASIQGHVTNNTAEVTWIASDITSQTWSYTLTYTVI